MGGGGDMVALIKTDNGIAQPQKSNEWYTPSKYIEAAREVMGGIDLDPASCFEANQIVRAAHYYTERENGLAQEWHGRVWLNPPYGTSTGHRRLGKSNLGLFIAKLVDEYTKGHATEAVLLTRADTIALWFKPLWEYPICFCERHIYFLYPDGTTNRHRFGTAFVYLGSNNQKFADVFCEFGPVFPADSAIRKNKEVAPIQLWEVTSG